MYPRKKKTATYYSAENGKLKRHFEFQKDKQLASEHFDQLHAIGDASFKAAKARGARAGQMPERVLDDAIQAEFEAMEAHQASCIIWPSSLTSSEPPRRGSGRLYADMFPGTEISAAGWSTEGEFFETIGRGLADPRFRIGATMTELAPATGGFSVPTQFVRRWLGRSLENEIVRPRCQIIPMTSDSMKIPAWDDTDHSSGDFAGIKGAWLAETGTAVDDDAAVRLKAFYAHKLALFTRASSELVADGVGFEEQLGQAMIASVGFNLDDAFLTGSGVGKPMGILVADSRVTVSKEVGQAASTIVFDNLKKMFARMYAKGATRGFWLAHPSTTPDLLGLSFTVGTGGSHVPAMSESNGTFRLLSRPVLFSEKMQEIGTEGDIAFVDLTQYIVGLRKEVSIEKSVHVGWQNDTIGYRSIMRVDGQPSWNAALTPRRGTDTLSWCVTLEDR